MLRFYRHRIFSLTVTLMKQVGKHSLRILVTFVNLYINIYNRKKRIAHNWGVISKAGGKEKTRLLQHFDSCVY